MLKRKNEIDVKLLRFAIEKTVGFETIVEKRFQGNTLDHANNPITNHSKSKLRRRFSLSIITVCSQSNDLERQR